MTTARALSIGFVGNAVTNPFGKVSGRLADLADASCAHFYIGRIEQVLSGPASVDVLIAHLDHRWFFDVAPARGAGWIRRGAELGCVRDHHRPDLRTARPEVRGDRVMTEAGFLDELGAILDQPGPLARGQKLGEMETFDSLGILNIITLFDTLGLEVEPSRIAEAATTDDLLGIAGTKPQA